MSFTLYNTLGHQKQEFAPADGETVKMYSCGPTLYGYTHIGNWSAYLFADLLVRSLRTLGGWDVDWAINITDVGHLTEDDVGMADTGEDKLEKAARKEGKTPQEIVAFYTEDFLKRWDELQISEPQHRPVATKHIKEMIKFVEDLIKKEVAYETSDGVYFSLEKFPEYGQLSGNKLEELQAGARVEVKEDKKNPHDFAVWIKAVGPHAKSLQQWDSPWGRGFPGWHLECSAMSEKIFGVDKKHGQIMDIHTGGEDNIFPHHECEIAQTGARHEGCVESRFWVHRKHVLMDGQKMSKSKGNTFSLTDVEERGFDLLDFKFLILGTHYRSQVNFTWENLEAVRKDRMKIIDFWRRLQEFEPFQKNGADDDFLVFESEEFINAIRDDLNTPKALGHFHDAMRAVNVMMDKEMLTPAQKQRAVTLVGLFDKIFAVFPETNVEVPDEVKKLAAERQLARQNGDWDKSDELRDELLERGWEVRDTAQGFDLKPVK